jgi:peptidoglycan/LPS O-acetylase OafA/YrhL
VGVALFPDSGEARRWPPGAATSRWIIPASCGYVRSMVALMSPAADASSSEPPHNHNQRPNYRADVDGLRAVAILSVVAYHLSPEQIPGGFLGVDVFFVISGFLISTIIFKSLANNSFSFVEFYAHRIRRIFPALILVIGFCLVVGWHALLPSEFILLGKHIVASTVFIENYQLWKEAGYFDIATSLKPLMHLWSLAIEEQFYLIFPLLVWGAWRLRLNLLLLVVVIFAVSFGAYLHDVNHKPIAAFFGPKQRFWELMAGAILAHIMLRHGGSLSALRGLGFRSGRTALASASKLLLGGDARASLVSIVGFLLIGFVVFGINRQLPLGNVTGEIFAVLGATLLISAGPTALANRIILSNRAVVFVGLISYPLYLWHWPLLSFLTIVEGNYPPFYLRALAVAVSVVLAFLTYRFVERPIRRRTIYRMRMTGGLAAASAALLLLGLFSRHLAPHYDGAIQKIMQVWNFGGYPDPKDLYFDQKYQFLALGHNEHNKIVLIGDSHAIQYRQTVNTILNAHSTDDGELPEVIFADYSSQEQLDQVESLSAKLPADKTVKTVVLSQFWAIKEGSNKINYAVRCCGTGLMQMVGEGARPPPMTEAQIEEKNKKLEDFVLALKQSGKEVYIVLDNPFGEELAPRSLLDRSFFHPIRIALVPLARDVAIERDQPVRSSLQKIAHDTGAKIIDPFEYLCDQNVCPALSADGSPLYKDYDHLSLYAATHDVHYLDFIAQRGTTE